jgi:hypothetical protein
MIMMARVWCELGLHGPILGSAQPTSIRNYRQDFGIRRCGICKAAWFAFEADAGTHWTLGWERATAEQVAELDQLK